VTGLLLASCILPTSGEFTWGHLASLREVPLAIYIGFMKAGCPGTPRAEAQSCGGQADIQPGEENPGRKAGSKSPEWGFEKDRRNIGHPHPPPKKNNQTSLVMCVLMCIIPGMDSRSIIKLIEADGWRQVRIAGSHHQFRHPTRPGTVTVPHPKKDLNIKTQNSILKKAGLK